ncbi:PDDEXK-like protein [Artemisia annua]|uniref:PDDEXK-like protein n=1 Tax=Artemisia annua TaxID=35608 RepID=A0A2U1Q2I3_ARTAN|nr:PDDEXK-like protein [Artemisia annua]
MGRLGNVAKAFEVAANLNYCESSGSEHSPKTMMDLSDLVNSFIEDGDHGVVVDDNDFGIMSINDECCSDHGIDDDTEEAKESLKRLFGSANGDDHVRQKLVLDVEKVWRRSSPHELSQSKRRLMARLRDKGHDAGLCKSKWEKKGRLLSGDHEYIDVNVGGTRYIIIVSLLEEFEIARPTSSYASLLDILPQISAFKLDELKEMVKIMSKAIKKSMKQMKMTVPPWRRREYVQAKWFGSYKRTTNEFPTNKITDMGINNKKTVGFLPTAPDICYGRRNESFARSYSFKMGNLAIIMNGAS